MGLGRPKTVLWCLTAENSFPAVWSDPVLSGGMSDRQVRESCGLPCSGIGDFVGGEAAAGLVRPRPPRRRPLPSFQPRPQPFVAFGRVEDGLRRRHEFGRRGDAIGFRRPKKPSRKSLIPSDVTSILCFGPCPHFCSLAVTVDAQFCGLSPMLGSRSPVIRKPNCRGFAPRNARLIRRSFSF